MRRHHRSKTSQRRFSFSNRCLRWCGNEHGYFVDHTVHRSIRSSGQAIDLSSTNIETRVWNCSLILSLQPLLWYMTQLLVWQLTCRPMRKVWSRIRPPKSQWSLEEHWHARDAHSICLFCLLCLLTNATLWRDWISFFRFLELCLGSHSKNTKYEKCSKMFCGISERSWTWPTAVKKLLFGFLVLAIFLPTFTPIKGPYSVILSHIALRFVAITFMVFYLVSSAVSSSPPSRRLDVKICTDLLSCNMAALPPSAFQISRPNIGSHHRLVQRLPLSNRQSTYSVLQIAWKIW